jgi:hypothetical protein
MLKTLFSCAVLLTIGWYARDLIHYAPATRTATVRVPEVPAIPHVRVN